MKLRGLHHVSSPYPPGRQDAVRAFYGKMLGLVEVRPPRSLEHMQLIWFSAGANSSELHFFPGVPDPEHPRHFCLETEDVEAARRELRAAGYEPYDDVPIPTRPRFFRRDPFGNLIEFTTLLGELE